MKQSRETNNMNEPHTDEHEKREKLQYTNLGI